MLFRSGLRVRPLAGGTTAVEAAAGYLPDVTAAGATRALLDRGATVVLTHSTTDGWGPCSVDRAAIANRAGADATVSIHADGGPTGGRGFHVLEPALLPGLTDDIVEPSHSLAVALRDSMARQSPFPVSDYIGTDGIMPRSDLGGLNRADVPAVFVECANMRNATDAVLLRDPATRQSIATAIVSGLETFLAR